MKVTALFSSFASSQEFASLLREACRSDELVLVDQSLEKFTVEMPEVISADLLIIECMSAESTDWKAIEEFNVTFPQATSVLIAAGDMEKILIQAMRVGVRDVIRFSEAETQIGSVIKRARARLESLSGRNIVGKILSFIPCKAGSGTSFISSNLAYVMANVIGKKVLFIDLDLQFSDASFYITEDDSGRSLADLLKSHEIDGTSLEAASIKVGKNLWVLRAPSNPEHSVGITPEQIDSLLTVATKRFDYVIVDLERTLDSISLRTMDRSIHVYPVLQAVLPNVRGTQRLLRTFRALHYPDDKIRLVANRQGNKHSDLSIEKIEAALHTKIFCQLPNDFINANLSIGAGKPLHEISGEGVLTRALVELGGVLVSEFEGANKAAEPFHKTNTSTQSGGFFKKLGTLLK